MTIDATALSVLAAATALPRREEAARPLDAGIEAVLAEIDATVLPRQLTFSTEAAQLVMMAGSGRLLRMVDPAVQQSDDRDAMLVSLSAVLRGYPADTSQTVLSEHLEEDVAAEEVGFSPAEIRAGLAAEPQEPVAVEPALFDGPAGEGLRGFYEGLEEIAFGQAFLLPNWEEIEISGEDILPESDDDMGRLLTETNILRHAIKELCGEQAILMCTEGTEVISVVFSSEGEVISHLEAPDLDGLSARWRHNCLKGEGK